MNIIKNFISLKAMPVLDISYKPRITEKNLELIPIKKISGVILISRQH